MVIVTFSDLLIIVVIIAFIIGFIIGRIKAWYDSKFKQNCFECKHYYLRNVAGAGDRCWYQCKLHSEFDDTHSFNDHYKYRKCKDFKKEGNDG